MCWLWWVGTWSTFWEASTRSEKEENIQVFLDDNRWEFCHSYKGGNWDSKKEADKEEDGKVAKKEAFAKNKKLRAKKKAVKSVKKPHIRAIKSNPKL